MVDGILVGDECYPSTNLIIITAILQNIKGTIRKKKRIEKLES